MRLLFGSTLLAISFSLPAAEVGLSLGSNLKYFDDTYGEMEKGPDRLGLYLRFARDWQIGAETIQRKGNRTIGNSGIPDRLLAPGTSNEEKILYQTKVSSYGAELKYAPRFFTHHQPGISISGGYNHYEESAPDLIGIDGPGSYYAAALSYDYFFSSHFSVGLIWRYQVDSVDADDIPADTTCNINCTGLGNIVYNPYAGLDVSSGKQHLKDRSMSFNFGYVF